MLKTIIFALAVSAVVAEGLEHDCNEKKQAAVGKAMPGRFIPKCETDGSYSMKQYRGATCNCVDDFGREIYGSVTPMHKCQALNCGDFHSACLKERLQKLTMLRRVPILGVMVPQCDKSGEYEPVQCFGHLNQCWCVGHDGTALKDTHKIMSDGEKPVCDSPCIKDRIRAQKLKKQTPPILGVFEPTCTSSGDYEVKQCHEYMCFCVDTETGYKIKGKSVPRKNADSLHC